MEPVTTTAMIGTVVGYLAKKLKDNASVQDFFGDFTSAAIDWIRPIFLTGDEQPKEVIEDLKQDPKEKLNTDAVENALAKAIKKDPSLELPLKALYEELKAKAPQMVKHNTISITGDGNKVYQNVSNSQITDNSINNSKNVNTGTIHAGGNVTIGDGDKAPK